MGDTPVPEGFRSSWSHSSLNTYSICPLKYYHEKVVFTVMDNGNPQAKWGNEVHEALEAYGKAHKPLPSNMSQYTQTAESIDKLRPMVSELHFEYKFAIDRNWNPTSWTGDGYYGRCAADILALGLLGDETRALVVDHKTGKYRGPTLQPVINAAMVFTFFPQVQVVETSFAYIVAKKNERNTFHRSNLAGDFNPVQILIDNMEHSVANHNFPMKRGFLCNKFCGVFSCPHNGRGR